MSAYELAVKTLQAQGGSVAKAAQLLREAADLLDPPTAEAATKRPRGALGGVAAAPDPLVAPTGHSGLSEVARVGLLGGHVVDTDLVGVYRNQSVADIDATIRRSAIELPDFELKQGLLALSTPREANPNLIAKVAATICAISNNGPLQGGTIIVGVTDKPTDAETIVRLDGITPRKVGTRSVVGVNREAKILGETPEKYFARWKLGIENSALSSPLKEDVLYSLSYHDYFGLGVIVITVPPQRELAFVGNTTYSRKGSETVEVADVKGISDLGKRFA